MLERRVELTFDLDLRLNSEFKFGTGVLRYLYAFYNAQEKILICSTKEASDYFKIPNTYYLGKIGHLSPKKNCVVLLESFSEFFKDYKLVPSEKDGRLCLILFNKGKDE